MKPRIRVKAVTRVLGMGVPDDAQPGDLVVGNRGAAARVCVCPHVFAGWNVVLYLEYVGNYDHGVRPYAGCKLYDRTGGTCPALTQAMKGVYVSLRAALRL